MKQYLISYVHGIGNEFPYCYQLVYANSEDEAIKKLKEHFFNKVYDIEICTIF